MKIINNISIFNNFKTDVFKIYKTLYHKKLGLLRIPNLLFFNFFFLISFTFLVKISNSSSCLSLKLSFFYFLPPILPPKRRLKPPFIYLTLRF